MANNLKEMFEKIKQVFSSYEAVDFEINEASSPDTFYLKFGNALIQIAFNNEYIKINEVDSDCIVVIEDEDEDTAIKIISKFINSGNNKSKGSIIIHRVAKEFNIKVRVSLPADPAVFSDIFGVLKVELVSQVDQKIINKFRERLFEEGLIREQKNNQYCFGLDDNFEIDVDPKRFVRGIRYKLKEKSKRG